MTVARDGCVDYSGSGSTGEHALKKMGVLFERWMGALEGSKQNNDGSCG